MGVTRLISEEVSWCILFADYIVLVNEIKRVINVKLEIWRDILECKGYIKWE